VVPKFDQDPEATFEALDEAIYRKLHGRAAVMLRKEVTEACMEPADLLHEALLRIASGKSQFRFQNIAHLIAVTTLVMRRVLIDRTRCSNYPARHKWLPFDSQMPRPAAYDTDSVAFRDILRRLADFDEGLFAVVQMRFYWGLGIDEIASVLSISSRTVKRDWTIARGWLRHKIGQSPRRTERRTCALANPRYSPARAARSHTRIRTANEWMPPVPDNVVLRQSA